MRPVEGTEGEMNCNCWVSKATEEVQVCTRWGAHNPQCPVYSPSLDPVDQIKDNHQRLMAEAN